LAEPQGIDQGSVFTLVGKDTTAAQRRAEFCAMDRDTTIKLMIITKYHHSFITIDGNLSDFEHYRLLKKTLWDSGKFLQIEFAVDLMQASGLTTGCSVLDLCQPLRAINLLDEFLAKKVKDNSKLGPVGKSVTLATLDAQTHDDLSAVIWGRAADASHGIAGCA
jgi:hypothetical protein